MRTFKPGAWIYFTPGVSLWYPELNVSAMPGEKVRSYSRGYGATFRKKFSFRFMCYLAASLCHMLISMVLELFKGNKSMANKMWLEFSGRVDGFISFGDGNYAIWLKKGEFWFWEGRGLSG